jgi:hypothetical protein
MQYSVVADSTKIKAGTHLTIFGHAVDELKIPFQLFGGDDLAIDLADGGAIGAKLVSLADEVAIIETPDHIRWRMTPSEEGKEPTDLKSKLPSQEWVIREQIGK